MDTQYLINTVTISSLPVAVMTISDHIVKASFKMLLLYKDFTLHWRQLVWLTWLERQHRACVVEDASTRRFLSLSFTLYKPFTTMPFSLALQTSHFPKS